MNATEYCERSQQFSEATHESAHPKIRPHRARPGRRRWAAHGRPGPGQSPAVGAAGARGRRAVHPAARGGRCHLPRPRRGPAGRAHPGPARGDVCAPAGVDRPAGGVQRRGVRARHGPPGEAGRAEGPAQPALLGLLGRPRPPDHAGGLAGPGPRHPGPHRARLHPRHRRALRPAWRAGGHGPDRQRGHRRHALARGTDLPWRTAPTSRSSARC